MANPGPAAYVAIYPDEEAARRACSTLPGEVRGVARIDDPHDRLSSLEGEMREELTNSIVAPQAGFIFTKEMTKSIAVLLPVGAVVGSLLALPLAAIAFGDTSVGVRVIWALVIGATMGGLIGTIVGAALGARGPADQSAAHVGVPLRVPAGPSDDVVIDLLVRQAPIRVDAIDSRGLPMGTITTEEEATGEGIFQHLRHQFSQDTGGDWSSARRGEIEQIQRVNRDIERVANEHDDEPS
jgi:hypothetical protein